MNDDLAPEGAVGKRIERGAAAGVILRSPAGKYWSEKEENAISNPILQAIKEGTAPPPARLAAAKGLLPLTNEEMLEVLVALADDESPEVREAARQSLDGLDPQNFMALAGDPQTPAKVLGFLCLWNRAPRELVEAAIFNRATPDAALAALARQSTDAAVIEAISVKQQSLINTPEVIEAILANPARSQEAERRAREVRQEFFEKEFGAEMVAREQQARAEVEATRAAEAARETVAIEGFDDLVRLGLLDETIDDSVVLEYENEFGPFASDPPGPHETFDYEEFLRQASDQEELDVDLSADRKPVFARIAMMSIKEKVMLALKGTREARQILVRDPNRMVAVAVLNNPKLTDSEVESIAALKTVPEDVLRQIAQNRAWTRSYTVIHNLARNPRTPIAQSLGFLNRILTRDLRALSNNKNIPDVIRTTAARMYLKRTSS